MRISYLIVGLQILDKHYDADHYICAEHDEIYLPPTDQPLSEEAYQELIALGWHQPGTDIYDPKEQWIAIT